MAKVVRIPEDLRIRKLRALRLADEAARRAAGTWGEMSFGEFTHDATDARFVMVTRGRNEPNLAARVKARPPYMSPEEHAALSEWVGRHGPAGYSYIVLGLNLSQAEARRALMARVQTQHDAGRLVINPKTAAS